ncbi:HSP20-like chaperone [Boletus coccyginus]|nr:HSP20-like chaperone [Boletus coccyginus]
MTAASTALISRKLSSQPTQQDRFRALDRALARRYVFHILREQSAALERRVHQGSLVYKPRLELCDDPSSSRLTAVLELPGMKSEDVRVHLDKNDTLLISGERCARMPSDQGSDVRYLAKEIKYGRFERVLHVPKGTMMSTISAAMNDGLLTVSWPRVPPTTASSPDSTLPQS